MAADFLKLQEWTISLGGIVRIFYACKFADASLVASDIGLGWCEWVLSNIIYEAGQAILRAKLFEIGVALSKLISIFFALCD